MVSSRTHLNECTNHFENETIICATMNESKLHENRYTIKWKYRMLASFVGWDALCVKRKTMPQLHNKWRITHKHELSRSFFCHVRLSLSLYIYRSLENSRNGRMVNKMCIAWKRIQWYIVILRKCSCLFSVHRQNTIYCYVNATLMPSYTNTILATLIHRCFSWLTFYLRTNHLSFNIEFFPLSLSFCLHFSIIFFLWKMLRFPFSITNCGFTIKLRKI